MENNFQVATLGGGCFWCVEGIFSRTKGVQKAVSGYTGGKTKNPTYKEICNGDTNHAEVVQITFDPSIITFDNILEIFFNTHDPTTLNRQGGDEGTQYRSVVYYHDEEQKKKTENYIKQLTEEKAFKDKIVTEVSPLGIFYPAEDYHQDYYTLNSNKNSYCSAVVGPKIKKYFVKYGNTFAKDK
eukprot:TRINITY_DN1028_c0_g2_i2.p1 TRINITY_DN1028_c0_g2~~TRINITY_DN1028_c0_g2_i2.p1  ORF type:complete len:184 (-),score=64.69 TRINITY_DN1028_c0_g2_i2:62-613(-)